ncbi:MAG: aminotransferase class I/II-fold pyridoxal phosphate-dependent enzyme [Gemmataceae bacterium]|nr:aminotransferase class I/II-fold pyridoxal phosphate-dependent enzyme [Gemmataceae bacterium]
MKLADRVRDFTESVIRETTRLANAHGAVNLGQGMPDFDPPPEMLAAAERALAGGYNQYAVTWGIAPLRQAIAAKAREFNGIDCDPDAHLTVCCGATESMIAAMLAIVDPGDEVVVFQPYYENYGPDAQLSGAKPVWVDLHPPEWSIDPDELRRAFSKKTRAIIVNTPNNPTGKVFTRAELELIAGLCREFDCYAITDEIYEHIIYCDTPHISLASLPGMADRTITISGLSKTFSCTGWRLGYCLASPALTGAIRKVHDFLTVGAPHPLQVAATVAYSLPREYYDKLTVDYRRRRGILLDYLREAGFQFHDPDGAYYVMADAADLGCAHDVEFVKMLVSQVGIAGVPGSSFYAPPERGRSKVRFMWAKKDDTLHEFGKRLRKWRTQ